MLVHVFAAIAWVGGGFTIQITHQLAFRRGGGTAVEQTRTQLAWADTWLAVPAPLLVVGTGIAMVATTPAWRFAQTWIWMSLAAVGLYEVLATTIGARLYRRLESAPEDDRRQEPSPIRSFIRLGNVLIALLVGVVFLMVFKPGIG